MSTNRQYRLKERPTGVPGPENFDFIEALIPEPAEGEALLRTLYLSLDPYMRGRMDDAKSYAEPVAVGGLMVGATIAEVVKTRADEVKVGDVVLAYTGWQEYGVQNAKHLRVLDDRVPYTTALGVLGMPGFTAWAGLTQIGKPQPGETVAVAAATGPVGSAVGQIAQLLGAKAVGIAGGPQKVQQLRDWGFDAALDHRSETFYDDLKHAVPDGIDVYFENVGGHVFQAVLPRLNPFARVPVCGLVANYSGQAELSPAGFSERVMRSILTKSLTFRGFIQFEFIKMEQEFLNQMTDWVADGKVQYREHIVDGFENTVQAFNNMLNGTNFGKTIVKVADL